MKTQGLGKRLPAELASVLERDIRAGHHQPGEQLPTESALAARFAVSRAAVREAIAQLRSAGLVYTRQGAGTYVSQNPSRGSVFSLPSGRFDAVELCYIFEIRTEVEAGAAALAARYRTDTDLAAMRDALQRLDHAVTRGQPAAEHDIRFHQAVAAASGNDFFTELLDFLAERIVESIVIARSNTAQTGGLEHNVQLEHRSVFEAIEDANPEAARAAMHVHLSNARKRLGLRRRTAGTEAPESRHE
ncbi:FadR/GntR family transcriptional regulator [Aquisalimonas lutea]|uniref:FadR/GntR family transcriptional regulator n=1 Tax=Aquisalimonas lutea TaxID=1327750 RepID=UPI0025B4377C|nr:FadR/GntR family transcriptional regulator [Aquisalimonas lutea]MDN3516287.1 FadR/GntR family transcriptional regulator [Aquisalimonas lutea]